MVGPAAVEVRAFCRVLTCIAWVRQSIKGLDETDKHDRLWDLGTARREVRWFQSSAQNASPRKTLKLPSQAVLSTLSLEMGWQVFSFPPYIERLLLSESIRHFKDIRHGLLNVSYLADLHTHTPPARVPLGYKGSPGKLSDTRPKTKC